MLLLPFILARRDDELLPWRLCDDGPLASELFIEERRLGVAELGFRVNVFKLLLFDGDFWAKNSSENLARFVLDVDNFLNMIIFPFCKLFVKLVAVALRPNKTFEFESLIRLNCVSCWRVAAGDEPRDACRRSIFKLFLNFSFLRKLLLLLFNLAKFVVLERITRFPELPPKARDC